jgi:hypothetical protein
VVTVTRVSRRRFDAMRDRRYDLGIHPIVKELTLHKGNSIPADSRPAPSRARGLVCLHTVLAFCSVASGHGRFDSAGFTQFLTQFAALPRLKSATSPGMRKPRSRLAVLRSALSTRPRHRPSSSTSRRGSGPCQSPRVRSPPARSPPVRASLLTPTLQARADREGHIRTTRRD